MEYKIEAFKQTWSPQGLIDKATDRANVLARQGWRVSGMTHGWTGFFTPKLYVVFEREIE